MQGGGHRRRNIAELISDNDLKKTTQDARRAELHRIQRVKRIRTQDNREIPLDELKKENLDPEKDDILSIQNEGDRVCLNPRSDGSLPTGKLGEDSAPALVSQQISKALKPHQIIGARFLWSHIGLNDFGLGCILADFMGLGKTLQVITVISTFLSMKKPGDNGKPERKWNRVLVLSPAICVRNWQAEFRKWIPPGEISKMGLYLLESSQQKTIKQRVEGIRPWFQKGGVLLMGYEMYRNLVLSAVDPSEISLSRPFTPQEKKYLNEVCLYFNDPGPDLIVLDEAHRVRNHTTKLVKALRNVKTSRRILLTGYPLQNHLMEYWTMVDFARPSFLGNHDEFKNRFANPIKNGECKDSCWEDVYLSRKRTFVLTHELKPLVLRRDQQFLRESLPPKKEWILMCKLSPLQAKLYKAFLREAVKIATESTTERAGLRVLEAFHTCLSLANHPDILHKLIVEERSKKRESDSSDGDSDAEFELIAKEDRSNFAAFDGRTVDGPKAGEADGDGGDSDSSSDIEFLGVRTVTENRHRLAFAEPYLGGHIPGLLGNSGKMVVLFEILRVCADIGDRVVIFSQSLTTLDIIQEFIYTHNDQLATSSNLHRYNFLRIDGSTPQTVRFQNIQMFNDPDDDHTIMLVSTKAGGEGVNLVGGNRVVMFDVCWNPSHDNQASTMEKKVYDLQIQKEGVSKRIVDDTPLERKFNQADLQQYFDIDQFKKSQRSAIVSEKCLDDDGEQEWTPGCEDLENEENEVVIKAKDDDDEEAKISNEDEGEEVEVVADSLPQQLVPEDSANDEHDRESVRRDPALSRVLRRIPNWLGDYYQQETMFEEDENELCTAEQKKEAMAEYEREEKGELPSFHRPTFERSPLPELPGQTDMVNTTRVIPPYLQNTMRQLHPNSSAEILQQRQEMIRRVEQHRRMQLEARRRAMQIRASRSSAVMDLSSDSLSPNASTTTPSSSQPMKGFRIFLFRRGVPNHAELKEKAKALGAIIEIELTTHTTVMVSAWPKAKVLSFLKIPHLPSYIAFRDVSWLETTINTKASLSSQSSAH